MSKLRTRRLIADALITNCGLWRLHGSGGLRLIRSVLDEIELQFLKKTQPCRRTDSRTEMYRHVHANVIKGDPIEYLEFGVFRGESIRAWTLINRNPNSRFSGFDSFQGLPEAWRPGQEQGHFDVGGLVPKIDDPRTQFIKGWFDETVPAFCRTFASSRRLVVHLDADLYSSTMTVLTQFTPFFSPGSLLIFDEFYDRAHEFKAFRDFISMSRKRYRVVCQTDDYGKVCIELV